MIVRITVVVTLVVEVVVWLGGGGGSVLPGECIIPANAETVSATVRIDTAHVRHNLFICCGAS